MKDPRLERLEEIEGKFAYIRVDSPEHFTGQDLHWLITQLRSEIEAHEETKKWLGTSELGKELLVKELSQLRAELEKMKFLERDWHYKDDLASKLALEQEINKIAVEALEDEATRKYDDDGDSARAALEAIKEKRSGPA